MQQVVYEITPGVEERAFRQVFWRFPTPDGQVAASPAALSGLWAGTKNADERTAHRVVLSMSWFRLALEEANPIMRFIPLWFAAEALDPLLRDRYDIEQFDDTWPKPTNPFSRGYRALVSRWGGIADEKPKPRSNAGLRAFESAFAPDGVKANAVGAAINLRRALFHAPRDGTREKMEAEAAAANTPLEDLITAAWAVLIGIDDSVLPGESVGPESLNFVLDALINGGDLDAWAAGDHPHLVIDGTTIQQGRSEEPGVQITSVTPTFREVNIPVGGFRRVGAGFAGPAGNFGLRIHDIA